MMTDSLQCVMKIIDKNQDKISQGDYLILCNQLKDIYNIIDQKWDPKPSDYILLKEGVREATKFFVFCVSFLLLLLSFFVIISLFVILIANLGMFLEE